MKLVIVLIAVAVFILWSACGLNAEKENASKNGIDSASAAKGRTIFESQCSGCHSFSGDKIGPNLSGIADSTSDEWLHRFIKNPQLMLDAGDKRAKDLVVKYKSVMPAFDQLSVHEVADIISFLKTHRKTAAEADSGYVTNPLPEQIPLSDVVVNIERFAEIPASSTERKKPLARITKLDYVPGTKNLLVADMRGKLYRLENHTASEYLNVASLKPNFVDQPGLGAGLCSFAFHPDFLSNGLFYTAHSETPAGVKADFEYGDPVKVTYQYVLTEWKATNSRARSFTGTSRELFRINMITVQHGIQEISFNPYAKKGDHDYGMLYVCIGDGGAMDDKYTFIAGDPHMPWGTIFRIDPLKHNGKNRQYGIPSDNPFSNGIHGLPEVYAYGFRNPHRISWASLSSCYVANVGEAHIESVYRLKKGMHHGWPIREGAFVIDPSKDVTKLKRMTKTDSGVAINYPIAAYGHSWGYAGNSGGFVYQGKLIPALKDKYVFGDIPSGKLFYFDVNDPIVKEWRVSFHNKVVPLTEICSSKRVDLHFGRDPSNELYILTKADGKIYRMVGGD